MDKFVKDGVRAEGLIPVFVSKTFPNHYSIATGLYPENHGLIGNHFYDPKFEEKKRKNMKFHARFSAKERVGHNAISEYFENL